MKYETHELRLASQSEKVNWIVGTFYTEQETAFDSRWSIEHQSLALRNRRSLLPHEPSKRRF